MVSYELAFLLLNLLHVIVGTFGVVFLALVLASAVEQRSALLAYTAGALGVALLAWLLHTVAAPVGPRAIKQNRWVAVGAIAGCTLVAFVAYVVAGALALVAAPTVGSLSLYGGVFVLVAALLMLVYASMGFAWMRGYGSLAQPLPMELLPETGVASVPEIPMRSPRLTLAPPDMGSLAVLAP